MFIVLINIAIANNRGSKRTNENLRLTKGRVMNVTLVEAVVALVPVSMLFSGSTVLFFREGERTLALRHAARQRE
jgi:hypothetical protein